MSWTPKKKTVSGNQIIDSSISFDNLGCTIDEDNMASDSATHVPTQQSVKAYVDANGGGGSSQWTTSGNDIYYNTGNVGIGTTSPSGSLVVSSSGEEGIEFFPNNFTNGNTIQHYDRLNSVYSIVKNIAADHRFNIGTTEAMRIDSTGFVGIGTTTPSTPLHIHTDDPDFIQEMDSTATASLIQHNFNVDGVTEGAVLYNKADEYFELRTRKELVFGAGNNAERMRIDSSGKVGINTTSPANTLTVGDLEASAIDQDGTVGIKCNANHKGIILQENSGAEQWSMGVGEAGSLKFYDSDSTTPAVTFADISGNVGIGTTSPATALHIDSSGATALTLQRNSGASSNISIKYDGASQDYYTGVASVSEDFVIGTSADLNGNNLLRVTSAGNVGIGTTNPIRALHVNSGNDTIRLQSTGSNTKIEMVNTGSTTNEFGFLSNNFFVSPDGTERLRIDSAGNVGINETNPEKPLHVNSGTGNIGIRVESTDTEAEIEFMDDATTDTLNSPRIGGKGNDLFMQTNGTERMRIDSSGNILVGKSANSVDVAGALIRADGKISACVEGDYAGIFHRKTSSGDDADGAIVHFRKDDVTVGSIGTNDINYIYIGNGDTNLAFSAPDDLIFPRGSQGIQRDGLIDLGSSANRFKDIHLSGSGYFGGNVGIGTTSPDAKLHVDGGDVKISSDLDSSNGDGKPAILFTETAADQVDAAIIYNGDGVSGDNNYVGIGVFDNTLAAEDTLAEQKLLTDLNITRDGKVGIGTTSPATALHIDSSGATALTLQRNSGASSNISIKYDGASQDYYTGVASVSEDFVIGTSADLNGNNLLRVTSAGNVGIGTTSPSFKLDVAGNARASYFALRSNETVPSESSFIYRPATGVLGFGTGTEERMRIDSSGNVGIGTTDPQASLHISAGTSGDATIIIEADTDNNNEDDNPSIGFKQDGGGLESQIGHTSYGSANQNALKIANSVASGGIEFLTGTTSGASNASSRMFIDTDGKVGIGTVTPAETLDIVGNIGVTGTVDGRDLATDGAKLDGIASGAQQCSTGNVTAAGALMDSELANINAVKNLDQDVNTTQNVTFSGLNINNGTPVLSMKTNSATVDDFRISVDSSSGDITFENHTNMGDEGGTITNFMNYNQYGLALGNGGANTSSQNGGVSVSGALYANATFQSTGTITGNSTMVVSGNVQLATGTGATCEIATNGGGITMGYITEDNTINGNTTCNHNFTASGDVVLGSATNDTHIQGNLDVTGSINSLNQTSLNIVDGQITMNHGYTGTTPLNLDIISERGSYTNAMLQWNDTNHKWLLYSPSATTTSSVTPYAILTPDNISDEITQLALDSGSSSAPAYTFDGDTNTGMFRSGYKTLSLTTNGSERLRVNATGDVAIGTTAPLNRLHVAFGKGNEETEIVRIQNTNALGNQDGRMIALYANTNLRGSLGYTEVSYGSGTFFAGPGCGLLATTQFSTHRVSPCDGIGDFKDDSVDLGSSSVRFDDVYATNGTIQTSDRNEKQDIEQLSDAESRVAVAAKGLLRKFRWIGAVEEKGDDARIHFGIIAQDLQDAFTAEGLDAGNYAMFIKTVWWEHEGEEYIQDAPEGAIEKTRLGIRYPELLAFIIAAL